MFLYFSCSTTAAYKDLVQASAGIFKGTNVTLGVASQKSLSFLRLFYDASSKKVYPFLTAIISVEKGRVTGITWDDACIFCGGLKEACEEDTYNFNGQQVTKDKAGQETKACFLTTDQCNEASKTNSTACDVTVYVVWSGTDAGGKALQSQAYRFSEFPPQELTDRLTQLVPSFGQSERRMEENAHFIDI